MPWMFPKVRQRVLGVLFGNVGRSFYANEVIALAQSGTGAVQRKRRLLADCGLLTVSKVGNQRHYQANASSPVFAELQGLVLKTVGLAMCCAMPWHHWQDRLKWRLCMALLPSSKTRRKATLMC